jgi:hypothetical protein
MMAPAGTRAAFPSPRLRGEGAERPSREAGEGALPDFEKPINRLLSLRSAIDLSPQAGRGKGRGAR